MDNEEYRKFRASDLPPLEQERLRRTLQIDLTAAMVSSIRENPPEIDLASIELVLRPGQQLLDWEITADCVTCVTCVTCGTCGTS